MKHNFQLSLCSSRGVLLQFKVLTYQYFKKKSVGLLLSQFFDYEFHTLNIKHWFLFEFSFRDTTYLQLQTMLISTRALFVWSEERKCKHMCLASIWALIDLVTVEIRKKKNPNSNIKTDCHVLILVCNRAAMMQVLSYMTPCSSPLQSAQWASFFLWQCLYCKLWEVDKQCTLGSAGLENTLWAYNKIPNMKFLTK